MASIDIDVRSIPRALQDLQDGVAEDIVAIVQEELAKAVVLAEQEAAQQGLIGVRTPGYATQFELTQRARGATLSNTAPYAEALEFGTRPYRPPLEPLREWAMGKLGLDRRTAGAVAKAIADKIESVGLPPRNVLGNVLTQIDTNIRRRLRRYIKDHNNGRSPTAVRIKQRYGSKTKDASVQG